ncbi:unnamed protein product [Rhodiola kirilowii]
MFHDNDGYCWVHEASGSNVRCENPEIMKVAEHGGIGPSSFRPHEAVLTPSQMSEKKENDIPQFLLKLYKIVDDPSTDTVVHWGFGGQSFVVVDETIFCKDILPNYFKHHNFSSFIHQLNDYHTEIREDDQTFVDDSELFWPLPSMVLLVSSYDLKPGFRKIDCDRWEYATKEFQRGKRELLKYIKRRGSYKKMSLGSKKQDETLHKSLCARISKLSQEVEVSNSRLTAFEKKVHLMELKYMKMSKTIENPGLITEDQTEIPSEQEMANTVVADDDPKQSSASKRLCMSAPSCGESSCRPHEAQGSEMLKLLESLHSELMTENEAFEGLEPKECIYYIHECDNLITVDVMQPHQVLHPPHQACRPYTPTMGRHRASALPRKDESNDDLEAATYMDTQPVDRKC